ncbi:hypothetical protein PSACC_02937 [Paramicrosporidium saccamoebae]|uniref:Uncharacterized protein n=1 Tax=Paramicrosporidium saccamoebae TaxID=1246581 RepID=A0A2H9THI7_9FUNG|nr:hypothetical protein PSACC_02937 [Paramicrosporidium saccamoebae]
MKTAWCFVLSIVAAASASEPVATTLAVPETSTTATAVPTESSAKTECKKATHGGSHVKIHMDLAQKGATKEEKRNMATLAKGVFKGVASVHNQISHTKSKTTDCASSAKTPSDSESKAAKYNRSKISKSKYKNSRRKGLDAHKFILSQLNKILNKRAQPCNCKKSYRYFRASKTVAKSVRELKSKEARVLAKLASKDVCGAEKHRLLSKLSHIRALQRRMHKNRFGPRTIGKKNCQWRNSKYGNSKTFGRLAKPNKNLKTKKLKSKTYSSSMSSKRSKMAKMSVSGKKTVATSSARQTGPMKNVAFVKNKTAKGSKFKYSKKNGSLKPAYKKPKKAAQQQPSPVNESTPQQQAKMTPDPLPEQKAQPQSTLQSGSNVQANTVAPVLNPSVTVPNMTQKVPKTPAQRAAKLQSKLHGGPNPQSQTNETASLANSNTAAPSTPHKVPKTFAQRAAKLQSKLHGGSKTQGQANTATPLAHSSAAAPNTAHKAPKTIAQRAAKLQRKLNNGSQPSAQSTAAPTTSSATQTSSTPSTVTPTNANGAAPLAAPQTSPTAADPTKVYTRSQVHKIYQSSRPLRKLLKRIAYTIVGWAVATAKEQQAAAVASK